MIFWRWRLRTLHWKEAWTPHCIQINSLQMLTVHEMLLLLRTLFWLRSWERRKLHWVCCFNVYYLINNLISLGVGENYMDTPGSQRQIAGAMLEGGKRMTTKLSQLPKPKNDFELVLPEDEENESEDQDSSMVCNLFNLSEVIFSILGLGWGCWRGQGSSRQGREASTREATSFTNSCYSTRIANSIQTEWSVL